MANTSKLNQAFTVYLSREQKTLRSKTITTQSGASPAIGRGVEADKRLPKVITDSRVTLSCDPHRIGMIHDKEFLREREREMHQHHHHEIQCEPL